MKYTVLFFAALTLSGIKYTQATLETVSLGDSRRSICVGCLTGYSPSGIIISHLGVSYLPISNKTLYVNAPNGYGILVSVRFIDLRPLEQDSLKIFAVDDDVIPFTYTNNGTLRHRMYYPHEELTFYAPKGKISITFTTTTNLTALGPGYVGNPALGYDGFKLIYTLQSDDCNSRNFQCDNGRCIELFLRCNGHNHCGDQSSEKNCVVPHSPLKTTLGIIFGGIFLFVIIACGVLIVIRRARRRAATNMQTIDDTHLTPTSSVSEYPQPGIYHSTPSPKFY